MLSFPYAETPFPSVWGSQTATVNYCEEDFVVTAYAAELINTLSNLAYVYYAWRGLNRLPKSDQIQHAKLQYYGLAAVGIASGAFHGLQKYYAQSEVKADDLSMLFATGVILHRIWTSEASHTMRSQTLVAMIVFLTAFSVWHVWVGDVLVHQSLFGVMIVAVGYRVFRAIGARADSSERRRLTELALFGAVSFVTGYGLWNVDNIACPRLNGTKRKIGMPWGFILELHGWWHILTAIGAYVFMALGDYLTENRGRDRQVKQGFAWPASLFIGATGKKAN